MPDAHDHLLRYAADIRRDRRANPAAVSEGTALELLLAPRMQQLLETLVAERHPQGPRVLPEYRRPGIGRPDIAFKRGGEPARAFIELKQPETSLNPRSLRGHDKDQFRRFAGLPVWGFCNFHIIHLYRRGEIEQQAFVLPAAAFTASEKEAFLESADRDPDVLDFVDIMRGGLDDFLPEPFQGRDWPSLFEIFNERSLGIQTKRDNFVYALSDSVIQDRIGALPHIEPSAAAEQFHETGARNVVDAIAAGFDPSLVRTVSYRPMDRRSLYLCREYVDRPRPVLQALWGDSNICLYALPKGTGAGPAVWAHGQLPDYHAFRGS
jgi:hypothetical protein